MKKRLVEFCGWYGAGAILCAYALLTFSILSPHSLGYQLLNGTGSLGIVVSSFYKKDYQPGVLNLVWFFVAAVGIFNLFH